MLYCTQEVTLKPIRFQFMHKVVQVCWEAVPNTWPSSSKANVAKCVVCAWTSEADVLDLPKPKCMLSAKH